MAKKPYIRIIGLTMVILLMGLFSPLYLPSGPVSAEDPVSNFDLGVTLLNPPAELATGSKAALTAVVSNYGTEKSPKASASFYIGEQLLTTKSISSIKPDNSKTLKIKMTIPGNIAEEKASLRVVITTALPEANLDNNSVKQSVNIVKPDLTINSVTAKKEIIPGKSASLSLEIANLYMARASSFNIQAYRNDSDVVMAVKKVSRLDLGTKTISLSVKIPKDFKKDGEYIRLVIDADDTVLEENEKNNVFNFNRENVRPTVITYEPEVNAVDVAQDANLVLTFIETVSAVSGKNITIKKAADNTAVAVIAADGPQVTVDGAVVTVNPDIDLDYSTAYYVQVEPGAFKSSFNADYSGIEDTSTWCFTTIKSTQATPTFSPSAGAVVFGTRLQIISNGAEHIYYTTDESNPATAVGGSTLEYDDTNRPVIDKAMTVKAIATRTNYNDSAIGSVFYTQTPSDDLTGLVLSGNPSNFNFSGNTYTYDHVTVKNAVDSITVTPTGEGTITVNGKTVSSGTASEAITLTPGQAQTITIVVTETEKTAKTYTINITRANSALATPTFSPAAGAVAFGTELQIISQGAEHIYYTTDESDPATEVGGSTLEYDDANRPVIDKAMTVKAIATRAGYDESVIGQAEYTQAKSNNLTNLTLSSVNISFSGSNYYYEATVNSAIGSTTVTPYGAGTITVNNQEVTSGTASDSISLTMGGTTTITVVVTETGKSSKYYTIKIFRQAPMGEIAAGTGSYADNNWISFGKSFSAVPVILVNAYDSAGKPLIAGVRTESGLAPERTGFTLKLHDLDNNIVTSNATVQWVAIIPGPYSIERIQAKYISYVYDGEYIPFDNAMGATYPIIICSAYDDSMAYPILAAPYSVNANGFTVSLKDADGNPTTAALSYIAIVPPANYNYYDEAAIVADYRPYNSNGSVLFDLTRAASAVICSAQKNNFAYAAAARNNSRYGFDLGLLDYDGTAGTSVWTSWLAIGLKY